MSRHGPVIRPATASDAAPIATLVRAERLNTRDLAWTRFLVADDRGRVVGCVQVRGHAGGTRELASLVVEPERRGEGLGQALVEAVLAHESGPVHLMTETRTIGWFERLGFRRLDDADVPDDLRGPYRTARLVTTLLSPLARRRLRVVVMRRDASVEGGGSSGSRRPAAGEIEAGGYS